MTRVAAFAAVVVVALAAGAEAPAKMEGRLFGLLGTRSGQFLLEVDPETLAPLPGRQLRLAAAGPGAPWTLDPARHRVAVARNGTLRLVDLAKLQFAGSIKLRLTEAAGVLWLQPERVVVIQRSALADVYEVTVVDPALRRVVRRKRLSGGVVIDSERTESEAVVLRAPRLSIGIARLLVVSSNGSTREVALPRIRAGTYWEPNADPPAGQQESPALAVDESRRIAYVVSPSGLVAEVPLDGDGSDVRYHTVRGRFAKLVAGAWRSAQVVGGRIVVTGSDSVVGRDGNGSPLARTLPAGLDVVDPSTWETRRIANGVSWVAAWRGGLVATGSTWNSQTGSDGGIGLATYGLDGALRSRALDGKRVGVASIYRDRAYAYVDSEEQMAVVDLVSGRVVARRSADLPWLLLEQASPIW